MSIITKINDEGYSSTIFVKKSELLELSKLITTNFGENQNNKP